MLAVGSWQLAVGSWQLAVGVLPTTVIHYQPPPPPPHFGDLVSPNQPETLARISGFLIVVVKKDHLLEVFVLW